MFETFEMVGAQNACALLVDHQAGSTPFPGDVDPVHPRNDTIIQERLPQRGMLSLTRQAHAEKAR